MHSCIYLPQTAHCTVKTLMMIPSLRCQVHCCWHCMVVVFCTRTSVIAATGGCLVSGVQRTVSTEHDLGQ